MFEFKKQKKTHITIIIASYKILRNIKYIGLIITGQSLSEHLRLPPPTYKHIKINIPQLINKNWITSNNWKSNHASDTLMTEIKFNNADGD